MAMSQVNLTKEIQEAARRRMDAGDSGDEWVSRVMDHDGVANVDLTKIYIQGVPRH